MIANVARDISEPSCTKRKSPNDRESHLPNNLTKHRNMKQAYYNICFEREAYANEADMSYLKHRKLFAAFKYL